MILKTNLFNWDTKLEKNYQLATTRSMTTVSWTSYSKNYSKRNLTHSKDLFFVIKILYKTFACINDYSSLHANHIFSDDIVVRIPKKIVFPSHTDGVIFSKNNVIIQEWIQRGWKHPATWTFMSLSWETLHGKIFFVIFLWRKRKTKKRYYPVALF